MTDTVQLLELERAHPTWTRAKHTAIHNLGLNPTRYTQQLLRALTTREALEHDAALVHHLTTRNTATANRRNAQLGRHTH